MEHAVWFDLLSGGTQRRLIAINEGKWVYFVRIVLYCEHFTKDIPLLPSSLTRVMKGRPFDGILSSQREYLLLLQQYQYLLFGSMIDRLLTLNFIVIIILTALLKIIGYRKIQPYKLYLLISTLLIVSCKVYNSIQYHHNMRLELTSPPLHPPIHEQEPETADKCVQLQVHFGQEKKKLKKIQYIDRKEGKYHDDFLLKYSSR